MSMILNLKVDLKTPEPKRIQLKYSHLLLSTP